MSRTWWSRGQLERALIARYGSGTRVNVAAAAKGLQVSPSTIRRWLDTPTWRHRSPIPEKQRRRIINAAAVPQWVAERDRRQAMRARESLVKIRGGMKPAETWLAHGWLEPHVVQVMDTRGRRLRYVRFTNLEQPWRHGHVLHEVRVPSRFHAEILVDLILEQMGPWRVSLDSALRDAGQYRAWVDSAPAVRLEKLAKQLPPPIAARKVASARAAAGEAWMARQRLLKERNERLTGSSDESTPDETGA